jgi:hypothetical protein
MKRFASIRRAVGVAAVLSFAACSPGSDAPAGSPEPGDLELGLAKRSNFTTCEQSTLSKVTEMLADIATALGATATAKSHCNDFAQELFTGTTLEQKANAKSDLIGGGGDVMADASLCALRDLSKGVAESSAGTSTVMGKVSVRQTVGYVDFSTQQKWMDGYHRVQVCAPVIGCLDAQRQKFRATVVGRSPARPSGLTSGDLAITGAYGLLLETEESDQSVEFVLPPITVPVPPPVFKIDAIPKAGYASWLRIVNTPFEGMQIDHARVPVTPFITPAVHDLYGRSPGTLWSWLLGKWTPVGYTDVQGWGTSNGWASQLALGSRNPDPNAAVWDQKVTTVSVPDIDSGKPITFQQWPLRPDADLGTPRAPIEKTPVVDFHAGVRVQYDPLDLVPGAFKSLAVLDVEQSLIFAEPKLDARYTAQFDMRFAEGFKLDPDGDARGHSMRMELGSASRGAITLSSGVDFVVSVNLVLGKKVIVKLHPRTTIELAGGEAKFATSPKSASSSIGPLTVFNSGAVDHTSFIDQCLKTPPPPKQPIPDPEHTPGDPDDLTGGILYPCNVCVDWPESMDIGGLPGGGDFILPAGHEKVRKSDDFATQDKKWVCAAPTNGCYDLCSYDPATGKITVKKSHTELPSTCGYVVK